jgi:hypothetical protein
VVARFTGGDTVGMRRAAELIINGVRTDHEVLLSLHAADALAWQRRPRLHTAAGEMDLRAQVDRALATTAAYGALPFTPGDRRLRPPLRSSRHWRGTTSRSLASSSCPAPGQQLIRAPSRRASLPRSA